MPKIDPCKRFACRIQDCLEANAFQQSKCEEALEDMRECCRKWTTASFVCGGIKAEEPAAKKAENKK